MLNLVVGDAHTKPGQDLSRFDALGLLIANVRPDVITLMGDFIDCQSFNFHSLNLPEEMEGVRYSDELETARRALTMMLAPMRAMQKQQRKNKDRLYQPRMIWIEGNHEVREKRWLKKNPQLIGLLDYRVLLGLDDMGFEFVPYRKKAEIEGVLFTHAAMNLMNQPIGGKYATPRALEASHKPIVFGHTHILQYDSVGRHDDGDPHRIDGLSVGCFFCHIDAYADGAPNRYWRGVLILDHYAPGFFNLQTIGMDSLMAQYGGGT